MAENRNVPIRIGQLNLRVPGNDAAPNHRMANSIARGLARDLSTGMHGHFGALNVQVQVPSNATQTQMSDAVTEAIMRALRR
jgi:hypothetical protein